MSQPDDPRVNSMFGEYRDTTYGRSAMVEEHRGRKALLSAMEDAFGE